MTTHTQTHINKTVEIAYHLTNQILFITSRSIWLSHRPLPEVYKWPGPRISLWMLDSTCGSFFTLRGAEFVALRFFAVPPSNVVRRFDPPHLRHVALPSICKNQFSSWRGLPGSAHEVAGSVCWRSLCGVRDTISDHFSCDNNPTNVTGGAILNERQHGTSLPKPRNHNGNRWADARNRARFDENGEYRVYQELLEGKKTRFVSRVMYDGTNYHGFQLQIKGQRTVQVRELGGQVVTFARVSLPIPFYT